MTAFAANTVIDTVTITGLTEPAAGVKKPADLGLQVPADAGYIIELAVWAGTPGPEFIANADYTLAIVLKPKANYEFSTNTTATVNGKSVKVTYSNAKQVDILQKYTASADGFQAVDSVSLTGVVYPAVGQTPVTAPATVPNGANYYASNVYWYKNGTSFSGTFVNGETYTAKIPVTPKDGYYFPDSMTATVNGKTAQIENNGPGRFIVLEFSSISTGKLDSAEISWVVPPVAGETPTVTPPKVPDGANYTAGNVYWYKDGQAFDGSFESGKTYQARIPLVAKDGYEFLWGATATVNGLPATVEIQESSHIEVRIDFVAGAKMDKIDIVWVVSPVTGETPTTTPPKVPDDANYFAGNVYWYKDGQPFDGSFEAGKTYQARIPVVAKEGCEFLWTVTATVNGKAATVEMQEVSHAEVRIDFVAAEKMYIIDILWVVSPVAGETPTVTPPKVPDGANYFAGNVYWYKDGQSFDGAFVSGETYQARIPVVAKDGFEFLWTVAATVNGKAATVEMQETSHVEVRIDFIAGAKMDKIDITGVVPPVAGETPDSTPSRVPEGANCFASNVYWFHNGQPFEGTFVAGETYKARIPLVAKENCEFLWSVTATVNGLPATVEMQESTHADVYIEFVATEQDGNNGTDLGPSGSDSTDLGPSDGSGNGTAGLGTWVIVGITVAATLAAEILLFVLFWFVIRKKKWADFLAIFKK